MSRHNELDRRHRGWRDLALAGAAAGAVTLLLVAAVALVWLLGRSPSQAPVLAVQDQTTPTPRALTFVRNTPTPVAAAPAEVPTATAVAPVAEATLAAATAPTVVATPEPPAISTESATTPTEDGGVIFEAPGRNEFETLATGSWTASADALINPGNSAVAEPWLVFTSVPSADFAVEAEMRVNGVLNSVCDQSFGLTAGVPAADQVYGGGLIFPCAAETARARLTDVSVWEDGYNADPVLAEETFDPGDDWHTYRLELRGDALRLLIDGVDVVSGTLEAPIDTSSGEAQAGIWAQGVELDVRSVAVQSLAAG